MHKVLAACVATWYAIRLEDLFMFVTGPCADTGIDIGAYNNLCAQINIGEDKVKHRANTFVFSVIAGEVYGHKSN